MRKAAFGGFPQRWLEIAGAWSILRRCCEHSFSLWRSARPVRRRRWRSRVPASTSSAIDPIGAAAAGFLAIRQWQVAGGDADPGRPRRLGHLLGGARDDPAAIARRDRGHRSAAAPTAASRASSPISTARSWTRRRVEAAGLDGLRDELRRIHDVGDKAALPALFAHLSRLWVRIPWALDIGAGRARCDALCRASRAEPSRPAGPRLLSQGRCAFPGDPHRLSRPHRQIADARRRAGGGEPAPTASSRSRPRWRGCNGRGSKTAIRSRPTTSARSRRFRR